MAIPWAPLPVGMKPRTFIVTGSTTETPPSPWFATKKTLPFGESLTSTGRPPTWIVPTTFIVFRATFTTVPSNSHPINRYEPSAEKSRWSGPLHGIVSGLISFHVCGSMKSSRS
jgi:hypothetical protein